jgi:membrane protein
MPVEWRKALQLWRKHRVSRVAAGLSFYAVFSLAPVIFIVVIMARAFGRADALSLVDSQLGLLIGQKGAHSVDTLVRASQHNVVSTPMFIGALLVLLAVFAIFMQVQEALDDVWEIPEHRRGGIWEIVVLRLHVVIAILALAVLVVAALYLAETRGRAAGIAANAVVLLIFLTVTYRTLPREEVGWRSAALGALITGIILLLGQAAMSLYFLRFHPENGYGAAGSFMIILIWIYYSAQLFLFGAVLTRAIED